MMEESLRIMLPGTAVLPLATVLTLVRSVGTAGEPGGASAPHREREDPGAIEAEYRARWDDGERPRD